MSVRCLRTDHDIAAVCNFWLQNLLNPDEAISALLMPSYLQAKIPRHGQAPRKAWSLARTG
ncbi:hypothetical protein BDV29DRAFT_170268 [Aspergillus leporis]|uniref:Uncharacterized protein n=1 Tax=Aspergillus leporis TaxID=41062 RepID=A0A5N5X8A6_9EURO|nr:hypothetical protein BDV29DRAFT_170268 [Aspergillus leporis]